MPKVDVFLERFVRILELGALSKIVHIERDDKGNIKNAEFSPNIKTGVKLFGIGKGEEALFQRVKVGLVNDDGSPDGAATSEISGWFSTLEPWQKVEFQMFLAALVGQSDQITAAVVFLRNLVDLGKDKEGDKKRTKLCIKERVFSKDPPPLYNAGKMIKRFLEPEFRKDVISRSKNFGLKTKKEIEKDFETSELSGPFANWAQRMIDKNLTKKRERAERRS